MGFFSNTAEKAHAMAVQAQQTADRSLSLIEKHMDECTQERRSASSWRATTDEVLKGQNDTLRDIKKIVAAAQRWIITTLVLILMSGIGWGVASMVHIDIGTAHDVQSDHTHHGS